jgi:hypothetical protein
VKVFAVMGPSGSPGGATPPALLPYIVGGAFILFGIVFPKMRRNDEIAVNTSLAAYVVGGFIILIFVASDVFGW